MLYCTDVCKQVVGSQRLNYLFCRDRLNQPREKENNCSDMPLETPSGEEKPEGKDAMPVRGSQVYISLVVRLQ